jgi:hypothetical protein
MTGAGTLILLRLGQTAAICVGALFLFVFYSTIVADLPLFTDPRFDGFWDDVEAYQFNQPGRKTPAELSRQYGMRPVIQYVVSPGLSAAYLPSERAAVLNVAIYSFSEDAQQNFLPLPVVWGSVLLWMFAPMVFTARQAQRALSWLVCRVPVARSARESYIAAIKETRLRAIAATCGVTFVLSLINALAHWSPELRQRGVTLFALTGWLMVMAFFAGLWLQFVLYLVDAAFLAAGSDPHCSLWPEFIALAVITPILVLVFHNSWLTITADAAAALTAGLFVKWSLLHHESPWQKMPFPFRDRVQGRTVYSTSRPASVSVTLTTTPTGTSVAFGKVWAA